jgi:cytochrome c556
MALKLPPEFVAVSIDTHQKFDDLAAAASSGATKAKVLEDLAHILTNCTSCHAGYRLATQ